MHDALPNSVDLCRDMANVNSGEEIEGIMTPQQSVKGCIKVIESKGIKHSGTFWTWENRVSCLPLLMAM